MQTINGIGTTLYGRRGLSKEELRGMKISWPDDLALPYIATEWFVFIFIPLIPLASYIILAQFKGENNFLSSKKYYQRIKINLNWNQVLKTWLIALFIISVIVLIFIFA